MACFYPLQGWKAKRVNDETGKRSVVFSPGAGFRDMPVQLPCGKCAGCAADKALSWSIRIHNEASLYSRNCFATLTYDDSFLPPDGKVHKRELQLFFKRLRKDGYDFRYFACGEYGDQTRRPHYHAVIFGQDFREGPTVLVNDESYYNVAVKKTWGKGSILLGSYSMASGCYVAGYVAKKVGKDDGFIMMSHGRRPDGGIGYRWIQKYHDDVRRTKGVVIEGKELPCPQRYLAWMEDELQEVKDERVRLVKDKIRTVGLYEISRELRAKEAIQLQRLEEKKRKERL